MVSRKAMSIVVSISIRSRPDGEAEGTPGAGVVGAAVTGAAVTGA